MRDVVQGLIKAGDASDTVIGQAYTIADDRRVTQAQYLNTIADCLQVPHASLHLPYSVLYTGGRVAELIWRALGWRNAAPPPVTTYGVTLLGGEQIFSIGKARRDLGYTPEYDINRGVAEGVHWYLQSKQGTQEMHAEPEVARLK